MKSILIVIIFTFSLESFAVGFGHFSCGEIVEFERDNNKNQMTGISLWFNGYIEGRDFDDNLDTFSDADSHFIESKGIKVIRAPRNTGVLSPIIHSIPVQLLAYHVALRKGTDVDKPRNLAKSVTVE